MSEDKLRIRLKRALTPPMVIIQKNSGVVFHIRSHGQLELNQSIEGVAIPIITSGSVVFDPLWWLWSQGTPDFPEGLGRFVPEGSAPTRPLPSGYPTSEAVFAEKLAKDLAGHPRAKQIRRWLREPWMEPQDLWSTMEQVILNENSMTISNVEITTEPPPVVRLIHSRLDDRPYTSLRNNYERHGECWVRCRVNLGGQKYEAVIVWSSLQ